MAKDACWVGNVYGRRGCVLFKTGERVVLFDVYSGHSYRVHRYRKKWVDNKGWEDDNSSLIRQKFDKTTQFDEATKGE